MEKGSQMTAHGVLPSYQGDNLVNLMAELERRLTGESPTRGFVPTWPG